MTFSLYSWSSVFSSLSNWFSSKYSSGWGSSWSKTKYSHWDDDHDGGYSWKSGWKSGWKFDRDWHRGDKDEDRDEDCDTTLEDIAESLPDTVTYTVEIEDNTADSSLTLASSDDRFDGASIDAAYCIAPELPATTGLPTEGDIYLANGDDVPAGTVAQPENLDLITWVMNEQFTFKDNGDDTGENYTESEVQGAIWKLATGDTYEVVGGDGTLENQEEIYQAAVNSGEAEGFEPGEDDLICFIIVPTDDAPEGQEQPFIFAMDYDTFDDCGKDHGGHGSHDWYC